MTLPLQVQAKIDEQLNEKFKVAESVGYGFIQSNHKAIAKRRRDYKEGAQFGYALANEWVSVKERLPGELETVWLLNIKTGWLCLGCRVYFEDSWHWAESNGIIYSENGKIVAECESEDLDVTHWCKLPTLPIY